MTGIVLILACAVIVEALVEYGKSIGALFAGRDIKAGVTQLIAVAVGIVVCLLTGADLFATVGITLTVPYAGSALTGIIASRGANYVSDLIGRLGKYTAKTDTANT